MDGAGFDPLNGDSDMTNDRAAVANAAGRFNRSDWLYLATGGAQGVAPTGSAGSAVFSWAGQVIMRSAWAGEHVDWAWFDVGPFGSSGHGHYDRLHLSVRSGGQPLLTDSGRFAYVRQTCMHFSMISSCVIQCLNRSDSESSPSPSSIDILCVHFLTPHSLSPLRCTWPCMHVSNILCQDGELAPYRTQYGSQTAGHNVIVLDGCGQAKGAQVAEAPIAAGSWGLSATKDFAFGSVQFDASCMDEARKDATHTRGVAHVRQEAQSSEGARGSSGGAASFWVVVDRLQGAAGATATVLWHVHPNATVTLDPASGGTLRQAMIRTAAGPGLDLMLATSSDSNTNGTNQTGPALAPTTTRGASSWVPSLVKGQVEPTKQGWYSRTYGEKQAADCLKLTGVVPPGNEHTIAWVIAPVRAGTEPQHGGSAVLKSVSAASATVMVSLPGRQPQEVVVRLVV
jgi:hypothetical protein